MHHRISISSSFILIAYTIYYTADKYSDNPNILTRTARVAATQKQAMSSSNLVGSQNFLFSPDKLKKLSQWNTIAEQLKEKNLSARPLKSDDYDFGYLHLLSQLTVVGTISRELFQTRFDDMKRVNAVNEHYLIVVIEDVTTKKIVAATTLFLELKFIHLCSVRGRIEEVVVEESYRKLKIGLLIVKILVELAREGFDCYKLTLDCTDQLEAFYLKNGFKHESNMVGIRFHD